MLCCSSSSILGGPARFRGAWLILLQPVPWIRFYSRNLRKDLFKFFAASFLGSFFQVING